ncbi:MAG: hypothetical protein JWM04_1127 [Verrucomicrobiales bacterium]|nr:hypothetical protein [Verrucomicrobiales bacterium]
MCGVKLRIRFSISIWKVGRCASLAVERGIVGHSIDFGAFYFGWGVLFCSMKERVYVGTSGWAYKAWARCFYPEGLPVGQQLSYYIRHFPTVEINATFYRLPGEGMVEGWRDKVRLNSEFIYSIKGSRFITHMKKLKDVDAGLDHFFDRIRPLHSRIGVFLWQLPPNLGRDLPRLASFLELLPRTTRHAVEFRNRSWLHPETFSLLRKHNVAHVWISSKSMPFETTVTADFIYLRFHGLAGGFSHDYNLKELRPWRDAIVKNTRHSPEAFVYFNNDGNARAPENAQLFMELIGESAVRIRAEGNHGRHRQAELALK